MARSNFTKHVVQQEALRLELLNTSPARELVEKIRQAVHQDNGISATDLGSLLKVPSTSLIEHFKQTESGRALRLQEEAAIRALFENLPRALCWKPVKEFADALGLHRNHIQSVIEQFGQEGMLMLARNNIMYISPRGENLAKRHFEKFEQIHQLPTVSQTAQDLGISPNLIHAFFAKRREPLTRDVHGRARMTTHQAEVIKEWRATLTKQRAQPDLTIKGVLHSSIIKIARQKADLLRVPGTPEHAKAALRAERTLRHFAKIAQFAHETECGLYVPARRGDLFINTISVGESARLMGVGRSTIRAWKRNNQRLTSNFISGARAPAILLPELLKHGERQYDENHKLKIRSNVPAVLTALELHDISSRFGLDLDVILSSWDVPPHVAKPILAKEGEIPRSWHRMIRSRLPSGSNGHGSLESLSRHLLMHLGTKGAVASAAGVARAVEYAASQRHESEEDVYQRVRRNFKLGSTWPENMRQLLENPHDSPRFPVSVPCYLYLIASPNLKSLVYEELTLNSQPEPGDIIVHQRLHDIGIVTSAERFSGAIRLKICSLSTQQERSFELDF